MKQRLPTPIDALKFRAEQYGWNQTQMAKALGLTRGHYSEVLNGKRRLSLEAIRAAVELGIPAKVILQPFPCEEPPR
jgi:HTH-type transcriptional regulator / antitoxin HigA